MKKETKEYLEYIKEINNKETIKDKDKILSDLLVQIGFIQHERFVHLIVTVFVGLSAILFIGLALEFELLGFVLLTMITIVLFAFYILHYYFLENSTQELYRIYNSIKEK